MAVPVIPCPHCRQALPDANLTADTWANCPRCDTLARVEVFPALFRPAVTGRSAEAIVLDGEAGCFYHPEKKAEVSCAGCGRFLCALCDVELAGRHLCPGCLETGARKGQIVALEQRRTLYANLSLTLALVPLLVWPLSFLTAPAVIVLVFYGARQPRSLVRRYWPGATLALVFALAELVACGFFFYMIFTTN